MKTAVAILVLCLGTSLLFPQVPSAGDADAVIEELLQDIDDEEDLSRRTEDVEHGLNHPVNIATAHYGELLRIPNMSPMVAMDLILLRDSVDVSATEQLLSLPTMTPELYSQILPFIVAEPVQSAGPTFDLLPSQAHGRTRLKQRLQMPRGEYEEKFLGDRYSAYQRIRIGNDRIEAAGIFEKDGGEMYSDGHVAGYGALHAIGPLRTIVIGTYSVSSAQGLVLAKNISPAKGSNTISQTKIRYSGITPAVSADEFRYFNGIAGQFEFGNWSAAAFTSRRMVHASVDLNGTITSYYPSGLFRTGNDKMKMKRVNEIASGGMIEYTIAPATHISTTFVRLMNDKYLSPAQFDFAGKKHISAVSLSGNAVWRNNDLYGEIATNDGKRFSTVFGITVPFNRTVQTSMHYRSFSKGYVNPLARPFGERTNIADGERGWYYGVRLQSGKWVLNAYVDSYGLPATTEKFGSSGSDVFVYSKLSFSKRLTIIAHIRNKKKKQQNIRLFDDERNQTNIRTECSYAFNASDRIRYRLEIVSTRYNPSRYTERGFLTFVEGRCATKKNNVTIISRLAMYDTDSFDARVYQYESDVVGNVSNPPLYGKGLRWYIVVKYSLTERLSLSCKYAETKKLFMNVIGSGNDEIRGSLDNSAAIQIDFKL